MTVLDHVPVERISERASSVRFSRVLVAVVAGVLFGLGWVAYKTLAVVWFAAVWCAMAVAEGWADARRGQVTRGPARAG
jgi:hypothetical protein